MTREEAIRDIEECVLPVVGGISLRMAIEALKKEIQHEWIPCSERLPDGSGEVLVTADYHGTLVVYSAWYNEMWEEFQRVPDEHIVIAWKELPEPYEKEGDNK